MIAKSLSTENSQNENRVKPLIRKIELTGKPRSSRQSKKRDPPVGHTVIHGLKNVFKS